MDRFHAVYEIDVPVSDAEARVDALLLEQSVELPRAALFPHPVVDEVLPTVVSVEALDEARVRAELAFPVAATGLEPTRLMTLLFGNASLQPDVALVDVELPNDLLVALGGPRCGVEGWRDALGARGRPLTCTALKPLGLGAGEIAELAEALALAGIDVIKDDHGIGDPPFCPFDERVAACQRAVERATERTGRRSIYAPCVSGAPATLRRQVDVALAEGVGALLMSPLTTGVGAFHEIARADPPLPVLAHPEWAGAARVAPEALLGRLFRAFGADAVIYPHHGGRFAYSRETCAALAERLRAPLGPTLPAVPTPAGGMRLERVPELIEFYGEDVMLLIGGSLQVPPGRVGPRARAFVEAVAGAANGGASSETGR
jgi:ribulose-bisphosphate carboxylase large chain